MKAAHAAIDPFFAEHVRSFDDEVFTADGECRSDLLPRQFLLIHLYTMASTAKTAAYRELTAWKFAALRISAADLFSGATACVIKNSTPRAACRDVAMDVSPGVLTGDAQLFSIGG